MALGVVLLLVAANAVYGGVGLVVDGMGRPADWLVNLPVRLLVLPGVALLLTVAVPQLAAAVVVWRSARLTSVAGVLATLALVLSIVVQLLVLQRYFVLQPVIAGLGWSRCCWDGLHDRGAGPPGGGRRSCAGVSRAPPMCPPRPAPIR